MAAVGEEFAEARYLALFGLGLSTGVPERRWTLEIINSFKIKQRYPNDADF